MARVLEVQGLGALLRATDRLGGDVKRVTRDELRKVAEPVRQEAASRFARYDARSAANYRVVVRRAGLVMVEQRLGRTTGKRPQFGSLQMRRALIPALHSNEERIAREMGDALDRIATRWGGLL